jgi:hypothetical protein
MKPVFKLEKWAVVYNVEHDPYTAPELKSQSLCGFRDGKPVTTSRVLGKSGNCVVTQNSLYMLGEPDPAYEKVYPNSLVRVFESLQEVETNFQSKGN